MSTKALKTQLLAAVAMVLVASVALGSSTYAWFASNNKVTATGMEVTAKSNVASLLISAKSNEVSEIQAENGTTVELTVDDSKVFPCKYKENVTNTSTATQAGNWYTATAEVATASAAKDDSQTNLSTFTSYVIHKQVWLTVAKNTAAVKDIKVSATFGGGDPDAIHPARVLVTSATAMQELSPATSDGNTSLSNSNLTDTEVLPLDIFIFIDGSDEKVYTTNMANLASASISLTFEAALA